MAARDTRKIVRGITVYDGADISTYHDDLDCDLLQEVLTPEEGKQLVEDGSLVGEPWSFKGKGERAPMKGSPLEQAKDDDARKRLEKAEEERRKRKALGTVDERRRAAREKKEKEESDEKVKASEEAAERGAKEAKEREKAEKKGEAHPGHAPPAQHPPQGQRGR